MSLPEPYWRLKTRPCPFYQKRRCLFNDSCNFIHGLSTKPVLAALEGVNTPRNLPRVIVDSPSSLSPSRSPRTTGLLLALKDVIGDPDEGLSSGTSAWSESLPTLVNRESLEDNHGDDCSMVEANWTAMSDESCILDVSLSQQSDDTRSSSLITEDASKEDATVDDANFDHPNPLGNFTSLPEESFDVSSSSSVVEDETVKLSSISNDSDLPSQPLPSLSSYINRCSGRSSGLLSPIEMSTLDLGPFRQSHAISFKTAVSEAADWKQPSPLQPSPPRSPSIASSMVELLASPFGSYSTRILSPRLSVFLTSPNLAATIPQQEIEPLDLTLDSPAGHSTTTPAPLIVEDITDSWNSRVIDCEDDGSSCDDDEEDFILGQSSGNTSIWDSECGQTSVYTGVDEEVVREQVMAAIRRASRTPTNFLSSLGISFSENETVHSSVTFDDVATEEDVCLPLHMALNESMTDASVHAEPNTSQPGRSDAFNSLYDIYSGLASPQIILSDSMRNAHLSPLQPGTALSSIASSSKGRVFTPPSPSSSRAANTDTLDSTRSPLTSLDSVSGRGSPFSQRGHENSTAKAAPTPESRKVPIASRNQSRSRRNHNGLSLNHQCSSGNTPLSPHSKYTASPPYSIASSVSSSDSSRIKGLKPLRLSASLNSRPLSRSLLESSFSNRFSSRTAHRMSNLSSNLSLSNNRLFSSARSSVIPLGSRSCPTSAGLNISTSLATLPLDEPLSAPLPSRRDSILHSSRLSECVEDENDTTNTFRHDVCDETIRRPIPSPLHTAPLSWATSGSHPYTAEASRPTLLFAIASDDVEQVKQVLESDCVNVNEAVGPQSALTFTLTNEKLSNKLEIVKTLLAYGADPSSLKKKSVQIPGLEDTTDEDKARKELDTKSALVDDLDYATRYYLERADAMHTKRSSGLIQRSFFRPLTRVRYELVGQDRALEQLFRVLSMRSRELTVAPIVVMMCGLLFIGPSGHGKSLLARKFGSLLEVPTHTVNMTTLRSSHDLWQSYSMSAYEEPSDCTLAEFLINNEGQRCVVVLDEIEKTADEKTLWSLYLPWELGRCAIESTGRQVDVRNVIWLGTSNIGHDLIFQYHESRRNPEELMSREEYLGVMGLLRPKVSERLGPSVLSRVSTVLPFVPFTLQEKKAICMEALHSLCGDAPHSLDKASVESIIDSAIADYYPTEGARSLHRAISNQMVDLL